LLQYKQWVRRNTTALSMLQCLDIGILVDTDPDEMRYFEVEFRVRVTPERSESWRDIFEIGTPGFDWDDQAVIRKKFSQCLNLEFGSIRAMILQPSLEHVSQAMEILGWHGGLGNKHVYCTFDY